MPVLTATNIGHSYGDRIIIDGVSLTIEPGDRLGIVGRNGCGKSTLLKCLGGVLTPDRGTVVLQKGCKAGYLTQDPTLDPDETLRGAAEGAFEALHETHRQLEKLFEAMSGVTDDAEVERLLRKQATLEAEMERLGGYAIDHKIDDVLHGLGFTDAQFGIKVRSLSGGQKGRLALARLLLEQPDLLLLDEPTNHLDIDGRIWLEEFLATQYRGAVVMISHDRYLLDRVVSRIIEVERARLIDYPGNYEAFREIRHQRRLTQFRAYQAQQDRFKKEEAFIRRYKAGQRAKQARGRETRLEREKEQSLLERPMDVEAFSLELPNAPRSSDVVVAARGVSKAYTNDSGTAKVLFRELDLVINRGERWGIIGPNGAGKSTLVRTLLGEIAPDAGTVRMGTNLVVGYYSQTHEHVPGDLTVWQYLQRVIMKESPGTAFSEQQARNLAGAFLFSGDEQEKQLGFASGGERSRAVLAGLLASAKNLLVLDEPTNHLDIPSAERLEEALAKGDAESGDQGYEGTLILISHDRALIDATCDHLIVMDGRGGAKVFHGTYTEWHEKETEKQREEERREAEEKERREAAERRRAEAAKDANAAMVRKVTKADPANPLSKLKTEEIERRIEAIDKAIKVLDNELADPDIWKDVEYANEVTSKRDELVAQKEPLELEWMRRAE